MVVREYDIRRDNSFPLFRRDFACNFDVSAFMIYRGVIFTLLVFVISECNGARLLFCSRIYFERIIPVINPRVTKGSRNLFSRLSLIDFLGI